MRSVPTLLLLLAAALPARAGNIDYNRDIRPILAENCTQCHGPDEGKRKGELRLDNRADALKEHDGVRAIVPGKPEASELVARVLTSDPEEIMPPPKAKKTLTAAQKEKLRQWVAEGAEFARHWAFEPVRAGRAAGDSSDGSDRSDRSDRRLRFRAPPAGKARAFTRGGPPDALSPARARSHRPAANARGGRDLRRRPGAGRLREARRSPARVAALRRALGPALARSRALCRQRRL